MASERTHEQVDVLIGGGGFAGLALAIALRQALGPSFTVTVADPALGKRRPRRARLRHRRGGAPAVRDHRRLGPGRGAADPRHGRHRQPAAGRGAADVPHLRRRRRAGRAVRAHDRERPAARRADGEGEGEGVVLRSSAVADISPPPQNAAEHSSRGASPVVDGVLADGTRNFGAACWSPPMARVRRSASAPASPATAGTTASPPSSPPSRTSAIITAAPRSISCRRGRSRSCR